MTDYVDFTKADAIKMLMYVKRLGRLTNHTAENYSGELRKHLENEFARIELFRLTMMKRIADEEREDLMTVADWINAEDRREQGL